jgi:hypothetical protein
LKVFVPATLDRCDDAHLTINQDADEASQPWSAIRTGLQKLVRALIEVAIERQRAKESEQREVVRRAPPLRERQSELTLSPVSIAHSHALPAQVAVNRRGVGAKVRADLG